MLLRPRRIDRSRQEYLCMYILPLRKAGHLHAVGSYTGNARRRDSSRNTNNVNIVAGKILETRYLPRRGQRSLLIFPGQTARKITHTVGAEKVFGTLSSGWWRTVRPILRTRRAIARGHTRCRSESRPQMAAFARGGAQPTLLPGHHSGQNGWDDRWRRRVRAGWGGSPTPTL